MITRESISADAPEPGFVHVQHEQLDDGVDMGGQLWFARDNLPWVVQTLEACLNTYGFPRTEEVHGDDSFRVFEAGPEQSPYVHLMNRRDKGLPHGGVYALQISKPIATTLLQHLSAL